MSENNRNKDEKFSVLNNGNGKRLSILELTQRVNEITAPIKEFQDRFSEKFMRFENDFGSQIRSVQDAFSRLPDFVKNLNELQQEAAINFEVMSRNGWFIDLETVGLKECLDIASAYVSIYDMDGDVKADSYLADHYERAMEECLSELKIETSESRFLIIKKAVEAHKSGNYSLSAPVFIMQADGHFHEKKAQGFWGNSKGTASLIKEFRSQSEKASYAFIAIGVMLESYNPVIANESERESHGEKPHIINRHLVLHGIDTNYGTRVNSCRAFAFMMFSILCIEDMMSTESATSLDQSQ